ncbi:MAG TPA: hypothetical protein VKA08_11265 [Balneolales bacterium]|nr:hypothetical protein [Balneolales bacterium]
MTLRRTILFSFCIVAGLIIISCSSNAGQNDFERQSLRTPSGYTHTNQKGQVDSSMVDPDDWRIAPMFQGYVYVSTPAYPNPVKSDIVTIELQVTGIQAINGMYLYKRNVNGQYQLLSSQPQAPLPTGLVYFSFNSVSLSDNNTYAGAIGLHRVFIYDNNNNLITYGDIKVE